MPDIIQGGIRRTADEGIVYMKFVVAGSALPANTVRQPGDSLYFARHATTDGYVLAVQV